MSAPFKLLACLVTVFGVAGTPYMYFSNSERPREKKAVKLGKTENGKVNLSLANIKNIDELLKEGNRRLSFKDIGMKFGGIDLSSDDILFSPCQNDIYYLLKAVSARQNKYQLENGEWSNTFNCWELPKYKHLNSVRLSWTRPTSSRPPLSLIYVGTCSLSKKIDSRNLGNFKLQITCGSGSEQIRGEFGEDSYEY